MALLNRAKMTVSGTPGTGAITLSAAVSGFASFTEAGAEDATVYTYVAEDGNDFEIGHGTYTESGTTFSRDTVLLSKISGTAGTTKLTLTSAATVAITIAAEDFNFATAAQGDKADSAVQPARSVSAGSGLSGGGDLSANRVISLNVANANTWTAQQTFQLSSSFATPLLITSTNTDAIAGPVMQLYRNSASPADLDTLGQISFVGRDESANFPIYATMGANIIDATAATVQGEYFFQAAVAGSNVNVFRASNGVQIGAPTGGYKGTGSLNASDVYNDNVALTCMGLAKEFIENGEVDLKKWDALVPDIIIPASKQRKAIIVETGKHQFATKTDGDGSLLYYDTGQPEKIHLHEWTPIYDEKGNGLDASYAPAYDIIEVPEQKLQRKHPIAHLFSDMLKDGFDPRDPVKYIAKLKADEALPGMPSRAEWEQRGHNSIGTGELFMRKWLAFEMLALVAINHEDRIAFLEKAKSSVQ